MTWTVKAFSELNVSEVYAMWKLRQDVFVVEQTCPYPDIDGTDEDWFHLLGWEGDQLVAYARLMWVNDEARIGRVVVAQSARGRSLGREVMQQAMKFIHATHANSSIVLSAQTYLLDFYQSLGFVSTSDTYLEDDIPHQEMEYKP
ncbi:GNAT family N-acetyltransferase [Lysobacter sp. N42]|nr:GNAT family N-acetyltransferase [Aliidiomarina sp. B3213]TCZ90327.1 GNAT family N-acetyltransferase [Lysobacter sp. N42]